MRIEWDEPKRLANLAKHGLDFADLAPAFFEGALVSFANRGRYLAVGLLQHRPVSVIFTSLGTEAISVVSLRAASAKERRKL